MGRNISSIARSCSALIMIPRLLRIPVKAKVFCWVGTCTTYTSSSTVYWGQHKARPIVLSRGLGLWMFLFASGSCWRCQKVWQENHSCQESKRHQLKTLYAHFNHACSLLQAHPSWILIDCLFDPINHLDNRSSWYFQDRPCCRSRFWSELAIYRMLWKRAQRHIAINCIEVFKIDYSPVVACQFFYFFQLNVPYCHLRKCHSVTEDNIKHPWPLFLLRLAFALTRLSLFNWGSGIFCALFVTG